MNNFLLYLGGLLVIIFITLFGLPYVVDWNSYRGVFEEEASRLLGREVRVAGNVELKLLPSPYLQVEKVRIGGAATQNSNNIFFKAEDLKIWISLPPLLKGVLEARNVELTRPVIETTVNFEGRSVPSPIQSNQGRVYSFVNNVTLQSVKITDGNLRIIAPNGSDLIRLDKLYGELSADALEGPFRFLGFYTDKDATKQIRINTGKSNSKGDLPFKAQVISAGLGNTYSIDAIATDVFIKPSIQGKFQAKINKLSFFSEGFFTPERFDLGKGNEQTTGLEVNSAIKISGDGLSFEELSVNNDITADPQTLTGRANISWKNQIDFDVSFSSKQFDCDKVLDLNRNLKNPPPIEFISAAAQAFKRLLPQKANLKFELNIDELFLIKQNIRGLRFLAETKENSLEIKNVQAVFPGDAKLLLSGDISDDTNEQSFFGKLTLDGQRLNQTIGWLSGDTIPTKTEGDGSFSLAADLEVTSGKIKFGKLKADYSDSHLTGDIKIVLEGKSRIEMDLRSEKINLDALQKSNILAGLDAMTGIVPFRYFSSDQNNSNFKNFDNNTLLPQVDWGLKLNSKAVIKNGIEVSNLEWVAASKDQSVSVDKIKLQSRDHFAIDLQSPGLDAAPVPDRKLRGSIEVFSPLGESRILQFLDASEDIRSRFKIWANLTPWKFDCDLNFGNINQSFLEFTLKGDVLEGTADIYGRVERPFGDWRKPPAKFNATISSPKISSLLNDPIHGDKVEKTDFSNLRFNRTGKLFIAAEGSPLDGMETSGKLETNESDLEFKGRISLSKDNYFLVDGNLFVDSKNLSDVIHLSGLSSRRSFSDVPIKGIVSVYNDGKKIQLKSNSVVLGQSSINGDVSWLFEEREKLSAIESNLSVDRISIPSLVSIFTRPLSQISSADQKILTGQGDGFSGAQSAVIGSQIPKDKISIWTDAPFDYEFLKQLDGNVKLNAKNLEFQTGLSIKNARLEFLLGSDNWETKLLQGEAFGGNVVSNLQIKFQPVGSLVKGQFSLVVPAEEFRGSSDKKASLVASLSSNFEAAAQNPRNLLDMLSGKGQLKIDHIILQGDGPKTVADVSKEFIQGKIRGSKVSLADVLRSKLKNYNWDIKNVSVPVEISGATLKIGKMDINSEYGNTSLQTDLDLQTLDVTSAWNLAIYPSSLEKQILKGSPKESPNVETLLKQRSENLLPSVKIIYSGGLANLSTAEPKIDADALERELLVRRLELDVNELETLRKKDEAASKVNITPYAQEQPDKKGVIGTLNDETNKKDPYSNVTIDVELKDSPATTSSTEQNVSLDKTNKPDPLEKINDDASLSQITQSDETSSSASTLTKGQQNQPPQKANKKKQTDSYWPSFEFWPF